MQINLVRDNLIEAQSVLENFIKSNESLEKIVKAGNELVNCINGGGKIISCGNGGSMSDAMHFAEELTGRFKDHRKSIPAISISDPSHITCVGNDYGFDKIFSRYVEGVGFKGDILLAISTSGNSPNIVNAAKAAKEKGMQVIALTGKEGGELAGLCDTEIRAPKTNYSDRIQEIHIKVIHILIDFIEQNL